MWYSEAFKRQVVEEIAQGKFASIYQAGRAHGVGGSKTVYDWVRKYGRAELLPKRIRIETMKERDELKEARKRIRELEVALRCRAADRQHQFHRDQCRSIHLFLQWPWTPC